MNKLSNLVWMTVISALAPLMAQSFTVDLVLTTPNCGNQRLQEVIRSYWSDTGSSQVNRTIPGYLVRNNQEETIEHCRRLDLCSTPAVFKT